MTTPAQIRALIKKGENTDLEFKRRPHIFEDFKLAKSLASMANAGGGKILIGITDEQEFEGVKFRNQDRDHIAQIAANHCDPPVAINFENISTTKGEVIILSVPPMKKGFPHGVLHNGALMFFKRILSTTTSPTIIELQELFTIPKSLSQKIDILTDDVPGKILEKIQHISHKEINGIYFCSPWLSELGISGADAVLQNATKGKIFEVLTRPPKELWHKEQVDFLREKCNAKIYVNEILHAKMYLISAGPASFAVFGSPNLTSSARTNIEIAMISHENSFVVDLYNVFQIHLKPLCRIL